jgi:hypothetical protein
MMFETLKNKEIKTSLRLHFKTTFLFSVSLILLTNNTIISNDFSLSSILLKICVIFFNNLFKRYYGKTDCCF